MGWRAIAYFGVVQLALEALLRSDAVAELLLQLNKAAAVGIDEVRGVMR